MWLFEVLFWASLTGVAQTYLLYPRLIRFLPSGQLKVNRLETDWPTVELIFAAFNEEAVIEKKLLSILRIDYPRESIIVTIGSDASTDLTDEIVRNYSEKFPFIELRRFEQRIGKASIINQLVEGSSADILVLTDANIIHTPDFLKNAVSILSQYPKFGAVGGTLLYSTSKDTGIAPQEHFYRSLENSVKHAESLFWGYPMGLEGGLYIVHRIHFASIPKNFYMEDFFQTLHLYCRGYKAIMHPEVIAFEDVSTQPAEEFQRKKRISIGNFQNLFHFFTCIHSRPLLAFVFWSHKGLRWFTPFLLLIALLANIYLAISNTGFYRVSLILAVAIVIMSLFGYLTLKLRIKLKIPQYFYHFLNMNFALLMGFIEYTKGVKSNVWQPTRRNQV